MENLRFLLNKYRNWYNSRRQRRVRRGIAKTTDTAAAGIGFVLRTALKVVVTLFLIFITTGVLFACIFAVYVKTCLTEDLNVTPEEMSLALSSTVLYKDQNGDWQELATFYAEEDRIWTDYEQIPKDLEHAAVAIEDMPFYEHKGVDWYRTLGAFVTMFGRMSNTFGGSTITQQLIKNLTEYDDVTVQRKLLEIFRALEFEKTYTKEEIMTWYLNEIYLGERCYGVGTAAKMYFGKDVSQLDLAECASLIGITNNPSLYDPYISERSRERNITRAKTILWEMYDQGYVTYDEYTAAVEETANLNFQQSSDFERPTVIWSWYVEAVRNDVIADLAADRGISESTAEHLLYNGGYRIYSCVDMNIQNIIDSVYENRSNLPGAERSSSQPLQSAIVIIDPDSGDIVGMSGGTGTKDANLLTNRATMSTRPPGSSFKPLAVYSPAIDLGLVTQTTLVNDSPNLELSGVKNWFPKNSGNSYSGWITIHDALVYSKNTVAAQLLDKIGLATSWDYLTNHFGITSLVREQLQSDGSTVSDYAYAPLSLGQLSWGITVREMAQAYTAFVNDGVMSYGRTYSYIEDADGDIVLLNPVRQVTALKANTAYNMAAMLQDAASYGTGREAGFGSTAVGGKTGTTSDDKDRWFCGFTMYYVAAVWTGYDIPEKMYFSGNPAAQIFHTIMSTIHQGYAYKSFPTATVGSATNLFGGLNTPEPSETPEPTETPEPDDFGPDTVTPPPDAIVEPGMFEPAPYEGPDGPISEPYPVSEPTPYTPDEPPYYDPMDGPAGELPPDPTAPPAPMDFVPGE